MKLFLLALCGVGLAFFLFVVGFRVYVDFHTTNLLLALGPSMMPVVFMCIIRWLMRGGIAPPLDDEKVSSKRGHTNS